MRQLATGRVAIPGSETVTLLLSRPEGMYTRTYPGVLTKIGAGDISSLEVTEPVQHLPTKVFNTDVSADLIRSISGWTNLRQLNLFHSTLREPAVQALNDLPAVKELRLRDADFNGDQLASVKWLKNLELLDIKCCRSPEKLVKALANSPRLHEINLDSCSPSAASLEALATCPQIDFISVEDMDVDQKKAAIFAKMPALRSLNLKASTFGSGALLILAQSKSLRDLNLTFATLNENELKAYHRLAPHCFIRYRPYNGPRF